MTDFTLEIPRRDPQKVARKALDASAKIWFLVAAIGQLIFAIYIAAFYGGTALRGNWEAWNKALIHGFIPGETMGNIAVGTHMLLAFIITVGGILQLVPKIRTQAPVFHRWNGRLYMATAFILSIGGIYMILDRGTLGGLAQHIAIVFNAVLIMAFAIIALRRVMRGDIKSHRKWALRLFLAVGGVWFFRVGFMLWMLVHGAPVGFDPKTFSGPFLYFLAFGQYLIPLAVLELYFRAQGRVSALHRFSVAGLVFSLTILMTVGIFGATMGMWLPRL